MRLTRDGLYSTRVGSSPRSVLAIPSSSVLLYIQYFLMYLLFCSALDATSARQILPRLGTLKTIAPRLAIAVAIAVVARAIPGSDSSPQVRDASLARVRPASFGSLLRLRLRAHFSPLLALALHSQCTAHSPFSFSLSLVPRLFPLSRTHTLYISAGTHFPCLSFLTQRILSGCANRGLCCTLADPFSDG